MFHNLQKWREIAYKKKNHKQRKSLLNTTPVFTTQA